MSELGDGKRMSETWLVSLYTEHLYNVMAAHTGVVGYWYDELVRGKFSRRKPTNEPENQE